MHNTASNELFLLMVHLSTVRDRDGIIRLFTEALSDIFEGLSFSFSDDSAPEACHFMEICANRHRFGNLIIRGDWESVQPEMAALVRNSAAMLALILENRYQAEQLADEMSLLEETVIQRTSDLIQANRELNALIEEKDKAERSLREKTEELEQYFNSSLDLLAIADTSGYFRLLNPEWEKVLGYEKSSLEGRLFIDLIHPDDREETLAALAQLIEGKEVLSFINRYQCCNGEYRWIEWNAFPKGNAIYAVARDITKRVEMEKELIETNEMLTFAQKSAHAGVWDWDIPSGKLNWSPEFFSLFGLDPEKDSATFETWRRVLYPDDLPAAEKRIFNAVRDHTHLTNEYRIVKPSGDMRWIHAFGSTQYDQEGRPLRMSGMSIDITEHRRAEDALRESEEKFRTAFRTSPDAILITRMKDGVFVDANDVFFETSGFTRDEIVGKSLAELRIWTDPAGRERFVADISRSGQVNNLEAQFRMKDGSIINGLMSASIITVDGATHILSITKNIDELKRAGEERARLATAIEQSPETIVITDASGTIVYVNPAFERITGYTEGESLGAKPSILKSGLHDEDFYRELWEAIKGGSVWSGHFINRKKDGSLYEEEATISPVKDSVGAIVNFVAVKRDVTKEVSLQKQLLQSQKLEAVGTLAGGVAHDFNNLLQVVIGFSELLMQNMKEGSSEHSDLKSILQAARTGAELVRGLLTFSRKVETKFQPLQINKSIMHIIRILERTFPRTIDIKTSLDPDLSEINADATQIEQVLMNLSLNARDAMPDGGTLIFETSNVTLGKAWCRLHLGLAEGRHVRLLISDTGQGMTRATIERVFEPFFTTKQIGSGTGLGLAIVYGIIQQHNGSIRCDSSPGKGSAFEIYFRAVEGGERPGEVESAAIPEVKGTETLLLADDEESIRVLGSRILAQAGYEVLLSGDGCEALELFRKERERISLVILDLSMPSMDGRNCLREIMSMHGRAKVLIMSGYAEEITPEECLEMGAAAFLGKPFRARELLQQVKTLLER